MKISAISSSNAIPRSKQNVNQNFKGLWGKGTHEHYEDSFIDSNSYTNYYYPFKNESQSSINNVVNRHTRSSRDSGDSRTVYDPITSEYDESVSVQKCLPFTEEEYKNYMRNPNSTAKRYIIEKCIIENDLEEYLHY